MNLWPKESGALKQAFGEAERVHKRRQKAELTAEVLRYLFSLPREQAAELAEDTGKMIELLEDWGFTIVDRAQLLQQDPEEPLAEGVQRLRSLPAELERVRDSHRLIELLEGAGFEV